MAEAEREGTRKGAPADHAAVKTSYTMGPSGEPDPDSEEFGRRLMNMGKPKPTSAIVYGIGPEESLRCDGRYNSVPIPARCEICDKTVPIPGRSKNIVSQDLIRANA